MNHLHEIAIIPTESISTKKHITLYATLDKDVNKFTAGREAVTSVAQPAPARAANKNIGNKKTPSRKASKPEYLYNDFDGLMNWEEFESLSGKELTIKEILKIAVDLYKTQLKEFYRLEIVNIETNEVIDYIEE